MCALYLNGPTLLDASKTMTESLGLGSANGESTVGLAHVLSLPAPGTVTFQCHSGAAGSGVGDIKLIAVQVGNPG